MERGVVTILLFARDKVTHENLKWPPQTARKAFTRLG